MMTQIGNKYELTNQANHMIDDAVDKQICHVYPQCSNQTG